MSVLVCVPFPYCVAQFLCSPRHHIAKSPTPWRSQKTLHLPQQEPQPQPWANASDLYPTPFSCKGPPGGVSSLAPTPHSDHILLFDL